MQHINWGELIMTYDLCENTLVKKYVGVRELNLLSLVHSLAYFFTDKCIHCSFYCIAVTSIMNIVEAYAA